jgi:hypothetical protein
MKGYLNVGLGTGTERLKKVFSLGMGGVRADVEENTWEGVVDRLGEFAYLSPIFLFGGGYMEGWTPETFYSLTAEVAKKIKRDNYFENVPVYFEIGNEPDIAVPLWRQDPRYLADTFWECYRFVKAIHGKIDLITGGIANLHENGLEWLAEFMEGLVQDNAIVGFHRYPNGPETATPHEGFPSREHEWIRLKSLAGGRRLFCTETGASTGPHRRKKDFPLCWLDEKFYISDKAQAEAYTTEYNFYQRRDVIGMVWYQYWDGPKRQALLDNYGVFDQYENEKEICAEIRKVLL